MDLRVRFPNWSKVRPEVFGNWYRLSYQEDRSSILIRLGVRLGTGPRLEEAEGNSTTKVDIEGTYLSASLFLALLSTDV